MRRRLLSAACLVAAAVTFSGCGEDTPTTPGGDLGTLSVRVSETVYYGVDPRPLPALTVATGRTYDVPVPSLDADLTVTGGVIRLDIHGLLPRDNAARPTSAPIALLPGPAVASRLLPVPEGEYALVVTYKSARDEYSLSVRNDRLDLAPVQVSISEPALNRYWRVPEDSFLYFCGELPEGSSCSAALDALVSRFGLEEFVYPPDGEHLQAQLPFGAEPGRTFLYPEGTDFNQIRTYFYETVYPFLLGVSAVPNLWIWDWRGDSIYLGPMIG